MTSKTPAGSLPHAPAHITVVWTHHDMDDGITFGQVARDWQNRGEAYVRGVLDLDDDTVILAIFSGTHRSLLGSAINDA